MLLLSVWDRKRIPQQCIYDSLFTLIVGNSTSRFWYVNIECDCTITANMKGQLWDHWDLLQQLVTPAYYQLYKRLCCAWKFPPSQGAWMPQRQKSDFCSHSLWGSSMLTGACLMSFRACGTQTSVGSRATIWKLRERSTTPIWKSC